MNAKEILKTRALRRAGGNTGRNMAAISADLLNNDGSKLALIAGGCFLSVNTLDRMKKDGGSDSYRPASETNERIWSYYGYGIEAINTRIKLEFQNKPKI